ncbi:phosphoribosyltransferase [Streptomyces prunicolor]|uniref:phosphoribosyltransferase n=1 Tax=Streptomyces prunicolor TaxID=67348 RepID=UPI00037607BF|nr:phosphoribosyltransferase [Streptomyces prunicolor]
MTVADPAGVYGTLVAPGAEPEQVRQGIFELSRVLAEATRAALPADATALCVIVLRGGQLLYPGFAPSFGHTDFSLLGMERDQEGRARCRYMTPPSRPLYDVAVLIDCVAATGGTLLAARQVLAESCKVSRHAAAVLCSSDRATRTLTGEGIDVLGFRLHEALDGDVVTPDLGELDAGDLFSGVSLFLRNASA